MRKAWFLGLLAASAIAVPTVASAQDDGGHGRGGWRNRSEQSQQQRPQRSEQRQEQRQERREQRQEARQQQAPEATPQAVEVQRERRQNSFRQERQAPVAQAEPWVGNPNDPARDRYERLERQNARRYGSEQQYRGVVNQQQAQGRYDRRDQVQDRRDNREWNRDRRDGRYNGNWGNNNGGWNGNGNWSGNRQGWNRSWRNDSRYDWRRFRDTNRFVFNIGPYYSPYRGYGYTRFGIGSILDSLFFGRNYWISNPYDYRLPYAPPGTQWVRYYNDVLLVDTYTGEVVDVIYDFFW